MHSQTKLRVRASDCDLLEHVNNSAYLNYILEAAVVADSGGPSRPLILSKLLIDYRKPAKYGDEVTVDCWDAEGQPTAFQLSLGNGDLVALAYVTWRSNGDSYPALLEAEPSDSIPFVLKPSRFAEDSIGKPFYWHRDVQMHQLVGRLPEGAMRLRPTCILEWVEQAIMVSSKKRGWPVSRMIEAGSLVLMARHDLHILGDAGWGDDITVISRIHELRKIRGTWRHEFRNTVTGELVAIDYSTGVFINLKGEVALPPPGLFESSLLGEPAPVD